MGIVDRVARDIETPVFVTELRWLHKDTPVARHGCLAEELKVALRKNYHKVEVLSYEDAVKKAKLFWPKYEDVNRVLCPDDPVFSIINSGTALSTTADNLTCQASTTNQGRILEIMMGGEAAASAVARVAVQRAGTSITGNSAITPEKFNSRSAAATGTYGKAGTQALVGNPMLSFAFNAFGGYWSWKAAPGEEIYYLGNGTTGEVVSMRSLSGTSTVSSTLVFEEL